MTDKHLLEVDFTKEIQASTATTCDSCGSKLGEGYYMRKKGAMSASLHVGTDDSGYDQYKDHHFCGEACMRAFLNKRAEDSDSKKK